MISSSFITIAAFQYNPRYKPNYPLFSVLHSLQSFLFALPSLHTKFHLLFYWFVKPAPYKLVQCSYNLNGSFVSTLGYFKA
jgi:hypothetical protein